MTQPINTTDLEELLEAEIPCGGIDVPAIARDCAQPAVLHSAGHGCVSPRPVQYKCLTCWKAWYQFHVSRLTSKGWLCCRHCGDTFTSLEAFSDYRPF
jgi:DNA-directed RNA polymerase subunit RPC12/RpoP